MYWNPPMNYPLNTTTYRGVTKRLFIFLLFLFALLPAHIFAQSDNCSVAPLLPSSPGCFTTNASLPGTATYTAIAGACGTSRKDVWYSFVANATNPTITLSSVTFANPQLQLYSGTCASPVSVSCGTTSLSPTGLTLGATYLIRIYSNTDAAGTFNICVTNPNDVCGSAVILTSGTSCVNVSGNMYGSTLTATTITSPDCASAAARDVWYRFVAQTTNPTITLSNIGAGFTNPGLQLLSNNCGSTFTPYFCGTTSIAADFLTPGTTYYIRVYTTGSGPVTPANGGFDICVQDPVSPAPFNDEVTNAINLPIWNTCNNIAGNMAGATASATALGGSCPGTLAYDVWYRFNAINTTATITLSSIGTNFLATRGVEIFSGAPGSLTSIACGATTATASSLTAGNTYYVRIYSTTAPLPNGNARFNICATTASAPVRFGNSYVNITRKTAGGVVQTGDILEIRMTINHTSGTMYGLRYVDNLPSHTAIANTAPNDSIKIITNEGLRFRKYTLTAGDDAGTYLASPPAGQYNIRLNLGFGTSAPGIPANNTSTESTSATGTMVAGSDNPRGGGGMLFAVSYRVVVTGVPGDTITLNPGRFIYKTTAGGSDITLTATPFKILISDALSLCSNSIGINQASESGGTFGSGTTLNRSTDLTIPIAGYTFINEVNAYNGVGDGRYALVKNISPRNGTVRTARRRNTCTAPAAIAEDNADNCNKRMFGGFWYIDGDHTGTTNDIGNIPPAATTNSGYMLMVNADYVASEVFRQTVNNLCPNTYYEFSAWIRNICPVCGIDSTGAQFAGTATAPSGGYPGVYPNLSFALNDVDYYSTGQVDTVGWVKKGFVFRTGASQTSAVFSIRNNSQGGGGNDWVLDDIAVATCLPTMNYSPTIHPNVCYGNSISIADTISSFFRNYTTYKWQRSVNGGASWTDITGITTLPDTNYYITTYTVPPAFTTLANNGDLYRVVVATTVPNLSDPNCNISDGVTITLSVTDCGIPLKTDLLSFNGKLVNDKGHLSWTTSKEDAPVLFTVERSSDGNNFIQAGTVNGLNDHIATTNSYSFIDPVAVTGKVFYRLIMSASTGAKKYSRTVQLSSTYVDNIGLMKVINPFNHSLEFDITSKTDATLEAELLDLFGKVVLKSSYTVRTGINALSLPNTSMLATGTYILRIRNSEVFINRKVLKKGG
jgi:trimeric autotransporter adhesin